MHSQQNRWPHGVAAGLSLGDMHREHRRRDRGKRATSAGVLSGATAGTRDGNACQVNEGGNTMERGAVFSVLAPSLTLECMGRVFSLRADGLPS